MFLKAENQRRLVSRILRSSLLNVSKGSKSEEVSLKDIEVLVDCEEQN